MSISHSARGGNSPPAALYGEGGENVRGRLPLPPPGGTRAYPGLALVAVFPVVLPLLRLEVEPVEKPVGDRGEADPGAGDEGDAAEQGVEGAEPFAGGVGRRIDRPH